MSSDVTPRKNIETGAGSYVADVTLVAFCLLTFGVLDPSVDTSGGMAASLQQAVNEGAPNLNNQLIWMTVACLGLVAIRKNIVRFVALVFAAWPLFVVFGYCLLSVVWSDQPVVSLRRCFGLIVPAFCVLAAVAALEKPERAARILYFSFWMALLGNLISLPLSGSFDSLGFFKGITTNKNTLGAIGALAILAGLALSPMISSFGQRVLLLVYIAGWAEVLFLSVSKTSIALAVGIPILFTVLAFASLSLRISIRAVTLLLAMACGVTAVFAFLSLQISVSDFVSLFWSDTTLTARTPIWTFMLENIERNWVFGIGFASFWSAGSASPNLYAPVEYIRLLNQAHNGYLDLAATLGAVGLFLVAILLGQAMRKADVVRLSHPWLYRLAWLILLFGVIHNMMESSFLVPFHIVWHIMLLTYLLTIRMGHGFTVTTSTSAADFDQPP